MNYRVVSKHGEFYLKNCTMENSYGKIIYFKEKVDNTKYIIKLTIPTEQVFYIEGKDYE